MKYISLLGLLLLLYPCLVSAQQKEAKVDSTYTPYELLSSYYNGNFHPFKKKNIYIGVDFNIEDKKLENTDYIIQKILDGERLNYDIHLKGGYYTGDYGMVGINFNYFNNRFDGIIFQDPDTVSSNSISRGFAFTPNFRSSVPLTSNERLSFFAQFGITFGVSNELNTTTKNMDEIERIYTDNFNFRLGVSPGLTFFAMENFAFEVQLDLLGYELNAAKRKINGIEESTQIRQNVNFEIDILSLQLGLAYYFGEGLRR
ncbi:hypothetical protein OU798_06440 [Prolixibacteraceae bacterium Z1-6]|uniref:Outer membrane protein beta-barrel domain-containing protein n=1 Tax=Draconibacterium aestuarii TaxID=2998507 RepID=A0A9X3F3P6_9BACT|nr:hypothetical protein [Prolixibacteraceae bacterium Z1-6]